VSEDGGRAGSRRLHPPRALMPSGAAAISTTQDHPETPGGMRDQAERDQVVQLAGAGTKVPQSARA
jgi:hypothetical protein